MRRTQSFFSRITRYPVGATNPRENRLTESLAALFETVDGLAQAVVGSWLDRVIRPESEVRVQTQRPTTGGRFVDLELAFGSAESPELLVWVENKHGSPYSGESQLENYLNDIEDEGLERHVLLLAPRHQALPHPPSGAGKATWERTATEISRFADNGGLSAVDHWLLNEFESYLKEEGLAEEAPLTDKHIGCLAAAPDTQRLIGGLLDRADQYVAKRWDTWSNEQRRGGTWLGSFRFFQTSAKVEMQRESWPEGWRFPFTFCPDQWFLEEARGSSAFFAGAALVTRGLPRNDPWLARTLANGFRYWEDEWGQYLLKPTYPDDLRGADSLDNQAEQLADWVCATFEELAESPPPTPG